MSPHIRRANYVALTSSQVSAYYRAKDFNLNHIPYSELVKQTLPSIGDICLVDVSPYYDNRPLISSTMSCGGIFNSSIS